jgi:hypothetical protein
MAVPPAAHPGAQGQGKPPPTPPTRSPSVKDATGSVLRTDEKELAFTLKIPNSEPNLGKVHKHFIDDLFRVSEHEITLLPSNDNTLPVPEAIREPKDYPKNDVDHRAFFRRHTNQRDTLVFHHLITNLSIDEIKKRMLPTLRASNLWLTNDSLKSKEMAVIAFAWKAPARLLHRPSFAKKINDHLQTMELNFEQQHLLKRSSNDAESPVLPEVFVNIRTIKHGNANRVETEAPAICAPKPYSRLMKELVSQIPLAVIGYELVPCGMIAKIGEENYRKALIANNDYNNCIRVIEILYMHSSHFELEVTYNGDKGKIGQWFKNSPLIIDVQPTNRTEEIGKYFIIVEDQHIAQARREIAALLRVFQHNKEAYGNHYPRFPCIANGPLADGAAERAAETLSKKFASLESDDPPSTQNGSDDLTAWSSSRKEIVFDWHSTREFPAPPNAKAPPAKTLPQVTFNDDAATQARSAYTTDIDTTVSELKTVVTESIAAQSKMLQQFMQNSQAQQQQLLSATQSQQATTNQLLLHLSNIMAALVPGATPLSPSTPLPNHPQHSSVTPTTSVANSANLSQSTTNSYTPVPPSNPIFTLQPTPTRKTTSPNKRPAPPDESPDRRRGSSANHSDSMQISSRDQDHSEEMQTDSNPNPADPNSASPLLDPDPGAQ